MGASEQGADHGSFRLSHAAGPRSSWVCFDYNSTLAAILATPVGSTRINLPISKVVHTVLALLPGLRALISTAPALPDFDPADVDRLEPRALALLHAHQLHTSAPKAPDPLPALLQRAIQERDLLLSDTRALANHIELDLTPLEGKLIRLNGYKNVAHDLNLVAVFLRERWPQIKGRCALDLAELDAAQCLAAAIVDGLGRRNQSPKTNVQTAAFVLLTNTYDQVRRAVVFLRWNHGDAELIAPSLYAGRSTRTRNDNDSNQVSR